LGNLLDITSPLDGWLEQALYIVVAMEIKATFLRRKRFL